MTIKTDENTDQVFAAALERKGKHTNCGYRINNVSVGHYWYTITVEANYRAYICYREGWGGLENVHIDATPEQDRALRAAHNL